MAQSRKNQWITGGLGVAFVAGAWASPVGAQTFGEQALASEKVVAIAVPLAGGNRYNLVILEQLTGQRPCWQERGSEPTIIDPLLLNFDFTNICGRSTDSNGYSLRLGGEDLGWQYELRVMPGRDRLNLVAFPTEDSTLPTLAIGTSDGLGPGYIKLDLHRDWQLTKRTYQGRSLGHFYFSRQESLARVNQTDRDRTFGAIVENPSPPRQPPQTLLPGMLPPPPPLGNPAAVTEDGSWIVFTATNPNPAAPFQSAPPAPLNYRVIVPSNNDFVRQQVQAIAPDAFYTWLNGRKVIQAGAFNQRGKADALHQQLRGQGLRAEISTY